MGLGLCSLLTRQTDKYAWVYAWTFVCVVRLFTPFLFFTGLLSEEGYVWVLKYVGTNNLIPMSMFSFAEREILKSRLKKKKSKRIQIKSKEHRIEAFMQQSMEEDKSWSTNLYVGKIFPRLQKLIEEPMVLQIKGMLH